MFQLSNSHTHTGMKYCIAKILRSMDALLKSCQRLSNVTIRCNDGLFSTHKIILASVSSFTREILEDIPSGDQVTVLMPDFGSGPIEDFLTSWMKQADFNPEIDRAFGNIIKEDLDGKENPSVEEPDGKENPSVEELADKENPSFEELAGKENPSFEELADKEYPSFEELVDKENPSVEELAGKENPSVEKLAGKENPFFELFIQTKGKIKGDRTGNARKRERVFDVSMIPLIDEKIKSLEHDLISLPLNDKDVRHNTFKVKSIALQKAYKEVISTGCSNRKAATKFGISETRLRLLIKCPEKDEYIGTGSKGKVAVFTREEEKIMVEKALEVSDGGLYMNCRLLKTVMDKEIDILNKDQPGRNIQYVPKGWVYRFGHRHRLFEKSNERKALEKHYECDVCFHKFKNAKLVSDHQKYTHFAFLNTHLNHVKKKKSVDKKLNSLTA